MSLFATPRCSWHDLSVSQVAEVLGVDDGTVRRRLARARSRLRGASA